LTDLAGAIVELYAFDAYGNAIGFDPSVALTEFLYSGEQFDSKIGQQYLRARYYDPATGRFNRLDPFFGNLNDPLSLHKYLYTHADPIQGVDPSGELAIFYLLALVSIFLLMTPQTAHAPAPFSGGHSSSTTIPPCADYALDRSYGDWNSFIKLVKGSSQTHQALLKLKEISLTTNAWTSEEGVTNDTEGWGYCVRWINNAWSKIKDLPGWRNMDNSLMYFSDDGYIIAITPEILDYNGWYPIFTSHAVLRVEIGKGYLHEGYVYMANINSSIRGFVPKGLLGVTYIDNGGYGGNDHIFDMNEEGKSSIPYPTFYHYLILAPDAVTVYLNFGKLSNSFHLLLC
jgi:RHS repeat-associated protein